MNPVDPFENIPEPTLNQPNPSYQTGAQQLSNLNTLSVGSGTQVLRFDKNGIFLGAATFATAPFSVSMGGVITSRSTISGNVITIDGGNARIVGNDGTTNRLVIGNV